MSEIDLKKIETQWTVHEWSAGSTNTTIVGTVADEIEAAQLISNKLKQNPTYRYVAVQTRYVQGWTI